MNRHPITKKNNRKSIKNEKFGRWTVVCRKGSDNNNRNSM